MRIDKFLWCVRLYPSRSRAAEACDRGHVRWNTAEAKASREVRTGDVIAVRVPPILRSYRVLGIPKSRVGAKLVTGLVEEVTSWEDLEKLELSRKVRGTHRDPGSGRPTKRDRRDIERFTDG